MILRQFKIYCVILFVFLGVTIIPGNAKQWSINDIEAPGYVAYPGSGTMAIDEQGNPHVAYGQYHLYYAFIKNGDWHYQVADYSFGVGSSASLALDPSGKAHIGYYDHVNKVVKYATNVSGAWSAVVVSSQDGIAEDIPISVSIDPSNKLHMCYNASNRLVYITNKTGSWVSREVDDVGSGADISLAVDSVGNVHVSYNKDLDLKYATNASGIWVSTTVDGSGVTEGGVGFRNALGLDSQDNVHIAYSDMNELSQKKIKYASNATTGWEIASVKDIDSAEIKFTSIAVDAQDIVYISHGRSVVSNATGSWVSNVETFANGDIYALAISSEEPGSPRVHTCYTTSNYTHLNYAVSPPGSDFKVGIVDRSRILLNNKSIQVDKSGKVHACYVNEGKIRYVSNTSGSWSIEVLGDIGFLTDDWFMVGSASMDVDTDGKVHIVFRKETYDDENGNIVTTIYYTTNSSGSFETVSLKESSMSMSRQILNLSIDLDANDRVHIIYGEQDTENGGGDIYYLTNVGGSWQEEDAVDGLDYFHSMSMALDTLGRVHICYIEEGSGLKYAGNSSGGWIVQTMDINATVESYPAIAVDAQSRPHIVYNDHEGKLLYAIHTDGQWLIETTGGEPEYQSRPDIALDSSGAAHIIYGGSRSLYLSNFMGYWKQYTVHSPATGGHSIVLDATDAAHFLFSAYEYDKFTTDWRITLKYATGSKLISDVYVSTAGGDDANDGLTWNSAKATIQAGADLVNSQGAGRVYVAAGRYIENLVLEEGVDLLGGYPVGGGDRNIRLNETIVDGGGMGSTIKKTGYGKINGLTITGGNSYAGGGIDADVPWKDPFMEIDSQYRLIIENCQITQNNGKGIHIYGDNFDIKNSIIRFNISNSAGGGIYHITNGGMEPEISVPTVDNCIVSRNTSTEGGGGGISSSGPIHILNSTIVNNLIATEATDSCGGVVSDGYGGAVSINNSILWGNTGKQLEGTQMPTFSCVQDSSMLTGEGNINQDPQLHMDDRLTRHSPCIDSGFTDQPSGPDIDGENRPYGEALDMGADEYIDSDIDNLPDFWEYQNFGDLSSDENADPDGDDVFNFQEYNYLTDPNDSESHPYVKTVFVDAMAGDENFHGLTESFPKKTIQDGIDTAEDGMTVIVKDGTYTGDGNTNINFNGKSIILKSANGADHTVIDCMGEGRAFYFGNGESSLSVLDGFTIQGGNEEYGAGAYIAYSDPTITRCVFKYNHARHGGAIFCNASSPRIAKCTISNNSSYHGGGGGGGGIGCLGGSAPEIVDCHIEGNTANFGGGIHLSSGQGRVTRCTIVDNQVTSYYSQVGYGGGIYCENDASAIIESCTIEGNTATTGGGVAFLNSSPLLYNSLLINNTARNDDYVYGGGGNCNLLWGQSVNKELHLL